VVSPAEIERRYSAIRKAMAEQQLDAVVVCGSEYTGFEGAVTYMSGFVIVHRYAYVILPREGAPTIVFPAEARYVGEHGTSWIEDQVFAERPGQYIGDRLAAQRVGVYGLDYVMAARDFDGTHVRVELVPFDVEFDLARAVKSETELESVRDSVRINTEGFWAFLAAYAPGKTAAEVLAPAEELFVEEGCGRLTMNMVLIGAEEHGAGRVLHPVTRDRRARRPLGRGVAFDRQAERRGEQDARSLRGVFRGGQGNSQAGRYLS
jgi:Xaa-Pro aminopeptidase